MDVNADFSSGNHGVVLGGPNNVKTLQLTEDPGYAVWPRTRIWYYVQLTDIDIKHPVHLTIRNHSFPPSDFEYRPVFSYDQKSWELFPDDQVSIAGDTLELKFKTEQKSRYIAFTFPYVEKDLFTFLKNRPSAQKRFIKETNHFFSNKTPTVVLPPKSADSSDMPFLTLPILKMAYPEPETQERRYSVWVHARAHPAETPSSYMMEGFLEQYLKDLENDTGLARKMRVYAAPLTNVQGIDAGCSRFTPYGERLEQSYVTGTRTQNLVPMAPRECLILNQYMKELLHAPVPICGDSRVTQVALNLHSSHTRDTLGVRGGFGVVHFGESDQLTSEQEDLYREQYCFLENVKKHGDAHIIPPGKGGGSVFLERDFPETWWWVNAGAKVMAMSIETTNARKYGSSTEWMTQEDHRILGRSLVKGLYGYFSGN